MASPFANSVGNGVMLCTSTVAGSRFGGNGPEGASDTYRIDVALGKPMLESIAQIAAAFDIKMGAVVVDDQLTVKLTDGVSTDYVLSETWHQQGLREGDAVVLEVV